VQARVDPKTRVRRLRQIDVEGISIVTFPLLPGARVRAVKQAKAPVAAPVRTRSLPPDMRARRTTLYQRGA
jgi:uncharacterized protein